MFGVQIAEESFTIACDNNAMFHLPCYVSQASETWHVTHHIYYKRIDWVV